MVSFITANTFTLINHSNKTIFSLRLFGFSGFIRTFACGINNILSFLKLTKYGK